MIREKVTLVPQGAAEGAAQPARAAARAGDRVPRGDAVRPRRRSPQALRALAAHAPRRGACRPMCSTASSCRRISSMNVRVVDAAWRGARPGPRLVALRAQLGEAAQLSFAAGGPGVRARGPARAGISASCPRSLTVVREGQRADRLSGAGRRGRQRRAAPARHARGGRGRDARRRAAPDAARSSRTRCARCDKGAAGLPAGRAAAARRRRRPTACTTTCCAAIVDRAFIGDDPLPRDAARSPSRSSARARACPRWRRAPAPARRDRRGACTRCRSVSRAAPPAHGAPRRGAARAARRAGPSGLLRAQRRGRSSATCRAI